MTRAKGKKVTVKFGEPPERRKYHWKEIADRLRKRPGEWALVQEELPSSVPWAINAGRVSAVSPTLGFETMTSGNRPVGEKGKRVCAELWMRYVPEKDESRAKQNGARK